MLGDPDINRLGGDNVHITIDFIDRLNKQWQSCLQLKVRQICSNSFLPPLLECLSSLFSLSDLSSLIRIATCYVENQQNLKSNVFVAFSVLHVPDGTATYLGLLLATADGFVLLPITFYALWYLKKNYWHKKIILKN